MTQLSLTNPRDAV